MGRREEWGEDNCKQCVVCSSFHRFGVYDSSILDPATNEELGTIPEMGVDETKEAIEAAKKAFPEWSRTTAKVRSSS